MLTRILRQGIPRSTKVKSLAKVCSDLISGARAQHLRVAGPVRLPTRILRLCVRKSTNEEGTNTYDRWDMHVHKGLINLHSPTWSSEASRTIVKALCWASALPAKQVATRLSPLPC